MPKNAQTLLGLEITPVKRNPIHADINGDGIVDRYDLVVPVDATNTRELTVRVARRKRVAREGLANALSYQELASLVAYLEKEK